MIKVNLDKFVKEMFVDEHKPFLNYETDAEGHAVLTAKQTPIKTFSTYDDMMDAIKDRITNIVLEVDDVREASNKIALFSKRGTGNVIIELDDDEYIIYVGVRQEDTPFSVVEENGTYTLCFAELFDKLILKLSK